MRTAIAVAGLLSAPAFVNADAVQDEVKKLQGIWKVVAIESDGKKGDNEILPVERITIKDDKLRVGQNEPSPFRLDPAKKPKEMDTLKSDGKTETRLIYALEGDELKLAFEFELFSSRIPERPTSFDTKGTRTLLLILKREKK